MNFYCKGYRLRMRRILSTAFLCLGLAAITGAALHYQEFDRSEELALHRTRNQILAQRLLESKEASTLAVYNKLTSSPLITSGVLIQEKPTVQTVIVDLSPPIETVETVTLGTPGVQTVTFNGFRKCSKGQRIKELKKLIERQERLIKFKVSHLEENLDVPQREKSTLESDGVRWVK